ncbi:lipoyl(octanoyl) transferase LipB [Salibacteraceae bacterium]|nr:lipoyl(octanoyl) transferase [Crocinitomicaceae bacterium]MDB9725397.1 lipoyl(octanoyl) transferase LipB [Salibacteraceae bacterium]
METVALERLGLIEFKDSWDYQEQLCKSNVEVKLKQRKIRDFKGDTSHHLIFCEHPLVYTLGKSGDESNLLAEQDTLKELGITYHKINRGGDITHHGPGQLVAYPILDLEKFFTDIHKYLRYLEEAVILTLKDYGINAGRYEGYTGVWLEAKDPLKVRKICAMGIRCSRWITMHGLALNVNNDLSFFKNIIPCGIEDKQVTSIEKELGRKVDITEVSNKLLHHLSKLFNFDVKEVK